jgi:hypothetical protein
VEWENVEYDRAQLTFATPEQARADRALFAEAKAERPPPRVRR